MATSMSESASRALRLGFELTLSTRQLLTGTVAMLAYPGTQAFDLRDERISIEVHKVFVHGVPSACKNRGD